MSLNFEQKQAVVAEVAEVASSAFSAVAAEYRGLTVAEMTELRAKARESGVYIRVVKNTLARRAFEGTEFECMNDALVGPLVLAFSQEDPGSAARLVRDYAKPNEKLVAKVIAISGELVEAEQIDRVANLPTRDEALSQLMAVTKAPIEKFVRTLNEPTAKMVRTFGAYRDQKQAA